ncbi:hypothetical protein THAOC_23345, partial [Thalassiosira oceanica]
MYPSWFFGWMRVWKRESVSVGKARGGFREPFLRPLAVSKAREISPNIRKPDVVSHLEAVRAVVRLGRGRDELGQRVDHPQHSRVHLLAAAATATVRGHRRQVSRDDGPDEGRGVVPRAELHDVPVRSAVSDAPACVPAAVPPEQPDARPATRPAASLANPSPSKPGRKRPSPRSLTKVSTRPSAVTDEGYRPSRAGAASGPVSTGGPPGLASAGRDARAHRSSRAPRRRTA